MSRLGTANPNYRHGLRQGVMIRGWTVAAKGETCCRNCGASDGRLHLHHAVPRVGLPARGAEGLAERDRLVYELPLVLARGLARALTGDLHRRRMGVHFDLATDRKEHRRMARQALPVTESTRGNSDESHAAACDHDSRVASTQWLLTGAPAYQSLRVELAVIFGPVQPREGQTWNEAMIARITERLVADGV